MSKQPPPAPTCTASEVGPCPTVIQIVGGPGTGSLPSTIAPPDHPIGRHKKRWEDNIKSGQEWNLTAQLAQLKTGQGGKGL